MPRENVLSPLKHLKYFLLKASLWVPLGETNDCDKAGFSTESSPGNFEGSAN